MDSRVEAKKSLSIRYSCQSGIDKNVFENITNEERLQLSSIVKKMLANGVRLMVNYREVGKED